MQQSLVVFVKSKQIHFICYHVVVKVDANLDRLQGRRDIKCEVPSKKLNSILKFIIIAVLGKSYKSLCDASL